MTAAELSRVTRGPIKGQVYCRKGALGWYRHVITSVQVGSVYFTTEDRWNRGKRRAIGCISVETWWSIAHRPLAEQEER